MVQRGCSPLIGGVRNGPISIACVDYDQESIDFSRNRHAPFSSHAEIVFVNDNVLRIATRKDNTETYGLQNLVYSVGIYDYLTDKVLKRLLTAQMGLLKDGGKMILAFKDCDAYDKTGYDWFLDWQFIQRTERQVFDLLGESGIRDVAIAVSRDASGIILFCVITKK